MGSSVSGAMRRAPRGAGVVVCSEEEITKPEGREGEGREGETPQRRDGQTLAIPHLGRGADAHSL